MMAFDREIVVGGRLVRIARIDGDKYRFVNDPVPVIEGLRQLKTRIDLFTFNQRLGDETPRFSYPMEWDNFAAIPLTTFEKWWQQDIGFKARNKAKQAGKKGVIVKEVPFDDSLVHGIWELYNECPIRQGRAFHHFGKNLETVRKEAATFLDASIFTGAFLDEKLIGFTKLTFDETRTQAGLMHIISAVQHRDKAPTNALVAQAVQTCVNSGAKYLVYSNFAYGNKLRDTLSDFKERNAFQQINVPRYYVPLTALGHVALKLGLHHRLVERVPEPILEKVRSLRQRWNRQKFQTARESFET